MLGLSPNKMEVIYQSGIEALRDDNIGDVRDKLIKKFEEQYPNAMGESFARSLISNIEPTDKHIKSLYWRISAKPDQKARCSKRHSTSPIFTMSIFCRRSRY
jgi:hypothetical protein